MVVITIIGILIALLLPAVQAARESARKLQCANNVKQLALGCTSHLAQIGWFPTDGWGWSWTGEPDRGFGVHQPGGWGYNVLPYIEQQTLHDLGAGNTGAQMLASQLQMYMSIVAIYNCPSRRPLSLYPYVLGSDIQNCGGPISQTERMDYGINAGDQLLNDNYGPSGYANGDNFNWGGWVDRSTPGTGISYQRSRFTAAHVTDGLSNTYLVGEANRDPDYYYSGQAADDNHSPFTGFENDSTRDAGQPPAQDTSGVGTWHGFGSTHAGSFNMSFCDGSVRTISYGIDLQTHQRLANRADGQPIDPTKY